jgi:hypothetical protein
LPDRAYRSPEVEAELLQCGADAFLRKTVPLLDVAQIAFGMDAAISKHEINPKGMIHHLCILCRHSILERLIPK